MLLAFAGCTKTLVDKTSSMDHTESVSSELPEKFFEQPLRGDFKIKDGSDTVLFTAEDLKSVGVVKNENDSDGSYVLQLNFTGEAGQRFADYTSKHIGESTYIYVGDVLISNPMIMEKIENGEVLVSSSDNSYESLLTIAALIKGK